MQATSEAWSITIPTLKDNLIARKKFRPDPQPSQPQQPFQQPGNEEAECEEETPRCTTCRYVKSRTCGSRTPGLSCRKPPPVALPSVASLSQSVSANCRYCCCTLCEFLKEIYKSVQGDPKSRVCDVLADLSDIFLAILTDCVLFIRRIGCTVTCSVINRSHRYTTLAKDKLVQKIKRSKSLFFLGDRLKSSTGLDGELKFPIASGDKSKTSTVPSDKSKSRRKTSGPGHRSKTRFIQGDRSKTWLIPEDEEASVDQSKRPAIRKSFRKNGSKYSKASKDDESISSSASDEESGRKNGSKHSKASKDDESISSSATDEESGMNKNEKSEQKQTCCETKKCKRLKCCLRRYLK